jgi:hypothetical protein
VKHLAAILLLASAAAAQPPEEQPPAPPPAHLPVAAAPKETLASLAPALQPIVRQRAMQFYRMPDGTIWDGWYAAEYRKLLSKSLKPYTKLEAPPVNPGQGIVEDHATGTAWKLKSSPDILAWDLIARLADEREELRENILEHSDPRTWTDAPPIWSSLQAHDFSWDFALVDEAEPDEYTRKTHQGYLQITRVWGDDRYEFTGYTLDRGPVSGMIQAPDAHRFINKDRFKGQFFLWPLGNVDAVGNSREAWRLIPVEELRMSPDDLADALIAGKAELATWTYEHLKDKYLWKRSTRTIELAAAPPAKPASPAKPPPPANAGGPDLLVLKDGRWFRGQILRRDDKEVVIRTPIGQMETEMTFKADEVQEIQQPEKR